MTDTLNSSGPAIDWDALVVDLEYTMTSVDLVAERLGVEANHLEHRLGEHGLEHCANCGWWVAIENLNDDLVCNDCNEDEDDD